MIALNIDGDKHGFSSGKVGIDGIQARIVTVIIGTSAGNHLVWEYYIYPKFTNEINYSGLTISGATFNL